MTATDEQLGIRPPILIRVLGSILVGVRIYLFVTGNGFRGWPVPPGALVAVVAVAFDVRMPSLSVIGTADGRVTLRNSWSTRTFHRHEVHDVDIDRANGRFGQGWALWLRLEDGGRHRIDVTQAPSRTLFARSLERDAERLRARLSGRPQPYR